MIAISGFFSCQNIDDYNKKSQGNKTTIPE